MLQKRTITRKRTRTAHGGSVSSCYSFPLGTEWFTSTVDEGREVILSVKNPNWRDDIRRGKSATTPFIGTEIEIDFTPGFTELERLCRVFGPSGPEDHWARESNNGYVNDGFSDTAVPSAPTTSLPAVTDAQARLKFIKRARDEQGAFRGSNFVAELAATLRGLRNPAQALRSGLDQYSAAARARVRKAIGRDPRGVRVRDLTDRQNRAASRAVAGSWLEHQFGWQPLISDIKDAAKALERMPFRSPLKHIYASQENRTVPSITHAFAQTFGLSVVTENHTFTTFRVQYYGAVKLQVSSPSASWSEEAGTRFRDFAPALWEWIPYSFLVDYFTNIGDMIEAASFPRSDLAWSSRSYVNTSHRDGSRLTFDVLDQDPYPLPGHTRVLALFPSAIVIRRKYVSRAEYTGSFVPSFQIEIPGMRNFKKYLNIGALLSLRGMRR